MTRFEVNLLLMLAASACGMVSRQPISAIFYGVLALWFCFRALFPKADRALLDEAGGNG